MSVGLYLLMYFWMLVYTKRWFKLDLIESEYKYSRNHPKKGRLNVVKGRDQRS